MRNANYTILGLLVLLWVIPAWGQERKGALGAEEALARLDGWRAEVEADKGRLGGRYGYRSAPATLHAEFDRAGVEWAKRYTGSWGGGVYLVWDTVGGYYDHVHRTLRGARSVAQRQGGVSAAQAAWLQRERESYQLKHERLTELMQGYVEALAQEARWLDAKRAGVAGAPTAADAELRRAQGLAGRAKAESRKDWPLGIKGEPTADEELADLQRHRERLHTELQRRLQRLLELPVDTDAERVEQIAARDRIDQMRATLEALDAEIAELGGSVEPLRDEVELPSEVAGQLPVPSYDLPQSRAGEAAQALREAQDRLASHLAARPNGRDVDALVAWQGEANERLAQTILAEERLAWEAGDAFTPEEDRMLDPLFANYQQVREHLGQLAENDADVQALVEQLRAHESYEGQLTGRMSQTGGTSFEGLMYSRLIQRRLAQEVRELESLGDDDRRALMDLFAENDRIVSEVHRSRRRRGVEAVNQRLREQAEAQGQTPDAFAIHAPRTEVERRDVERRVLAAAYARLGAEDQELGAGAHGALWTADELASGQAGVRVFDHRERRRLLGDAAADRIGRLEGRR